MKNLFGPAALAAAVVSLAVACGGGAPVASPSSAARTPSASSAAPSATIPAPSDTPSDTPSAAPSAAPSVPASPPAGGPSLAPIFSNHADPALEALLPATVSGTNMHRYSLTLTQVLDAGGDRLGITAFLESMNKTEADGSFAAAFDPTNTLAGSINAFKVAGADGAALLAGITTIEVSDFGTGAVREQATVGNKSVTVVSVGDGINDTKWIYGHGDVVFVVHAANDSDAAAYLTALP